MVLEDAYGSINKIGPSSSDIGDFNSTIHYENQYSYSTGGTYSISNSGVNLQNAPFLLISSASHTFSFDNEGDFSRSEAGTEIAGAYSRHYDESSGASLNNSGVYSIDSTGFVIDGVKVENGSVTSNLDSSFDGNLTTTSSNGEIQALLDVDHSQSYSDSLNYINDNGLVTGDGAFAQSLSTSSSASVSSSVNFQEVDSQQRDVQGVLNSTQIDQYHIDYVDSGTYSLAGFRAGEYTQIENTNMSLNTSTSASFSKTTGNKSESGTIQSTSDSVRSISYSQSGNYLNNSVSGEFSNVETIDAEIQTSINGSESSSNTYGPQSTIYSHVEFATESSSYSDVGTFIDDVSSKSRSASFDFDKITTNSVSVSVSNIFAVDTSYGSSTSTSDRDSTVSLIESGSYSEVDGIRVSSASFTETTDLVAHTTGESDGTLRLKISSTYVDVGTFSTELTTTTSLTASETGSYEQSGGSRSRSASFSQLTVDHNVNIANTTVSSTAKNSNGEVFEYKTETNNLTASKTVSLTETGTYSDSGSGVTRTINFNETYDSNSHLTNEVIRIEPGLNEVILSKSGTTRKGYSILTDDRYTNSHGGESGSRTVTAGETNSQASFSSTEVFSGTQTFESGFQNFNYDGQSQLNPNAIIATDISGFGWIFINNGISNEELDELNTLVLSRVSSGPNVKMEDFGVTITFETAKYSGSQIESGNYTFITSGPNVLTDDRFTSRTTNHERSFERTVIESGEFKITRRVVVDNELFIFYEKGFFVSLQEGSGGTANDTISQITRQGGVTTENGTFTDSEKNTNKTYSATITEYVNPQWVELDEGSNNSPLEAKDKGNLIEFETSDRIYSRDSKNGTYTINGAGEERDGDYFENEKNLTERDQLNIGRIEFVNQPRTINYQSWGDNSTEFESQLSDATFHFENDIQSEAGKLKYRRKSAANNHVSSSESTSFDETPDIAQNYVVSTDAKMAFTDLPLLAQHPYGGFQGFHSTHGFGLGSGVHSTTFSESVHEEQSYNEDGPIKRAGGITYSASTQHSETSLSNAHSTTEDVWSGSANVVAAPVYQVSNSGQLAGYLDLTGNYSNTESLSQSSSFTSGQNGSYHYDSEIPSGWDWSAYFDGDETVQPWTTSEGTRTDNGVFSSTLIEIVSTTSSQSTNLSSVESHHVDGSEASISNAIRTTSVGTSSSSNYTETGTYTDSGVGDERGGVDHISGNRSISAIPGDGELPVTLSIEHTSLFSQYESGTNNVHFSITGSVPDVSNSGSNSHSTSIPDDPSCTGGAWEMSAVTDLFESRTFSSSYSVSGTTTGDAGTEPVSIQDYEENSSASFTQNFSEDGEESIGDCSHNWHTTENDTYVETMHDEGHVPADGISIGTLTLTSTTSEIHANSDSIPDHNYSTYAPQTEVEVTEYPDEPDPGTLGDVFSTELGLDALQLAIDGIGLITGFGIPADLISGGISFARGDFVGVGLSLVGVIPFFGEGGGRENSARRGKNWQSRCKNRCKNGEGYGSWGEIREQDW